jgi:hypothetical protein
MPTMDHAQLLQVWNLLTAIVERQTPFVQIMITVGTAFFIVMAIEGVRTSLLAIRRGHSEPPASAKPDSAPPAAAANDVAVTRSYSARGTPRPVARPVKKIHLGALASERRLTSAIRRIPRSNSRGDSPETTSF